MRYRKSCGPVLAASQIVGTSWAASRWPESGGFVSTGSSPTAALAITIGADTAGGIEAGAAAGPSPADGSGAQTSAGAALSAPASGEGCQNGMRSSGKP